MNVFDDERVTDLVSGAAEVRKDGVTYRVFCNTGPDDWYVTVGDDVSEEFRTARDAAGDLMHGYPTRAAAVTAVLA